MGVSSVSVEGQKGKARVPTSFCRPTCLKNTRCVLSTLDRAEGQKGKARVPTVFWKPNHSKEYHVCQQHIQTGGRAEEQGECPHHVRSITHSGEGCSARQGECPHHFRKAKSFERTPRVSATHLNERKGKRAR